MSRTKSAAVNRTRRFRSHGTFRERAAHSPTQVSFVRRAEPTRTIRRIYFVYTRACRQRTTGNIANDFRVFSTVVWKYFRNGNSSSKRVGDVERLRNANDRRSPTGATRRVSRALIRSRPLALPGQSERAGVYEFRLPRAPADEPYGIS